MLKKFQNIKNFKKFNAIMALIWTAMTLFFFIYQIQNENQHFRNSAIQRLKNISNSSKSLLYWAYDIKAKQKQNGTHAVNFSVTSMLKNIIKKEKLDYTIEFSYDEEDMLGLDKSKQKLIKNIQKNQKDGYIFFNTKNQDYIYYLAPLVSNGSCVACHIHADDQSGKTVGFISMTKEIPNFSVENHKGYYFLIFSYLITWMIGIFAIWYYYKEGVNFLNEEIENFESYIYTLVSVIEKRDTYTAGHGKRVAKYAKLIAQKLKLTQDEIDLIYKAGILHDIGKVEIPDALLLKPEQLTKKEFELIKRHPVSSHELLSKGPFKNLSKIVLYHHERYDGLGYPEGLSGDDIPLLSRIIAIADTFDAMTTNRIYRPALSVAKTVKIMDEASGTQFDPKIFKIAKEILLKQNTENQITQLPQNELEEFRFSYYFKDQLTNVYSIKYLSLILNYKYKYSDFYLYYVSFLNFSKYNKKYGWKKGDALLIKIARKLEESYEGNKIVRVHGDNFLILRKYDISQEKIYKKISSIFKEENFNIKCKKLVIKKGEKVDLEKFETVLLS